MTRITDNADILLARLESGVRHATDQLALAIGGIKRDVYAAKAHLVDEEKIQRRMLVNSDGGYQAVSPLTREGKIAGYRQMLKREKEQRTRLRRDIKALYKPMASARPNDMAAQMALANAEAELHRVEATIGFFTAQLSNLGAPV